MASKVKPSFGISILPDDVIHTNISVSKDDYNSARIVAKMGDKEYVSVSCEWQGKTIPGFVMDLMAFMKGNGIEKSGVWPGKEAAYTEYTESDDLEVD